MSSDNGSNAGGYDERTDWTRDNDSVGPSIPSYQESSGGSGGRRRYTAPVVRRNDEDLEEECCCCSVDPVLCWFRFFHTIAGLLGLATMAANIYVIAKIDSKTLNYKDIIMRSYAVIFCIVIVATEIDWRYAMKRLRILDLWFFRGFFYFFVGFITIEGDSTFTQPQDIVGLTLICVGAFYALMGILCIKSIKIQRLALLEEQKRDRDPDAYVSV